MACNNCNNDNYNPCKCTSTYEPCNTEPLIIPCDDPEYCEDVYSDKCIIHSGATLVNINATEGTRLDVILANINASLGTNTLTAASLIALINGNSSLQTLIYNIAHPEVD